MKTNCILFLSFMLLVLTSCAEHSNIMPEMLTCEYMENPAVLDVRSPRLSWINEAVSDGIRGEYQQAYRICVASSRENLLEGKADIWDSGKVLSADSYLIPYGGSPLQSDRKSVV